MENVKYTSDGKKVVVIGNLNAQEKIVQEVFVVNDQEVPSGDNFVVKSLHDAPAISWQEKRTNEIQENYNRRKSETERLIKELENRYKDIRVSVGQKCQFLKQFIDEAAIESFDVLTKFLTGEIKYVVRGGYHPAILDYNKEEIDTSFGDRDLKLLTLFGKSDGTLTWGINAYRDGSGGYTAWHGVATDYEEAREILKEEIKKYGGINKHVIQASQKHDIPLNPKLLDEYKSKRKQEFLENIERNKQDIKDREKSIKEIEDL